MKLKKKKKSIISQEQSPKYIQIYMYVLKQNNKKKIFTLSN